MAEDDLSPLQRAVQEAIDRSGKARDHLDGQLRVSLKTKGKPLWDVLRGKSKKPEPRTLRAIEAVLELRAGTLVELVHGGVTHGEAPAQPIARTADAGETVEIIRLDLSLPMGPGASVDDYVEEEPLRFDLGYVQAFTRTPAHRLRLAHGVGDSMFPTLLNSDLVWIDSTQTTLNQADKVWAVSINGAAAIKRLRPLREGKVLVISDNPTIENYEVAADELRIGGRVIRFARDL